MTNTHDSTHDNLGHRGTVDLFEAALDALRSAGVGFEVVGDFRGFDTSLEPFERAA